MVKVGVMVMVPLIGALVALVAAKTGTVFEPDAANPMDWLLFVQAYEVPVPAMAKAVELEPLQ